MLQLVTLLMGWTILVPIFHDNATPEIPEITIPFIDDVLIKGLVSRYRNSDRMYETIPGNSGIRHFIWEHFQNLNRVVQRMKFSGGTFLDQRLLYVLKRSQWWVTDVHMREGCQKQIELG